MKRVKIDKLVKINTEERLYAFAGSALGFENARQWTNDVADWLARPDLSMTAEDGTVEAYAQYSAAMDAGSVYNIRTKKRCPAFLTPCLVGLEGKRIEVLGTEGRRRFIVGKSCGWMPCHLEIARRDSSGGPAVVFDFAPNSVWVL